MWTVWKWVKKQHCSISQNKAEKKDKVKMVDIPKLLNAKGISKTKRFLNVLPSQLQLLFQGLEVDVKKHNKSG